MNDFYAQRIVVFRTDRIGEVLLSTVALDILKSNMPQAEIAFVTSQYSAGLLGGNEGLEEIVALEPFKKMFWLWQAFVLSRKLRKRNFDMAVVLNAHKILHVACFLAGIPKRCGYDRKWAFLLTHRVKDQRDQARMHEVEYTKDFFRRIGLQVNDARPCLCVEEGMEEMIRAELRERSVDFQLPLVVIHPCASNPLKFWSAQKYRQLLYRMKDVECKVVVIGEENEYDAIVDIIGDSGCPVLNAAGMFSLPELAGLLSISSLFIGNDSGPMHMAAVLGKPVISIFSTRESGSNPVRWRPWGENHAIFHELHGQKPCQLENLTGCYVARDDISADEVFQMVCSCLNECANGASGEVRKF